MKTRACLKYFVPGCGLLGNLLTSKDTVIAGEGTIRAGQDF